MKKYLLLLVLIVSFNNYSQNSWNRVNQTSKSISKNIERLSFPKEFQLYETSFSDLNSILIQSPNRLTSSSSSVIISIPNMLGNLEQYEIFEYSNFTPELQAQYPNIRSYVGKGITDKSATIRLSSDPKGIQAMIFRTDKRNEFIEPYTNDGSVYVMYESQRNKGELPFVCSTDDTHITKNLSANLPSTNRSSNAELLNFRLALSCNGEYANYFGATSAAQSGLVLAAFNATMTRVNGVFEKDFAIHMNIVVETTNVIYYNPSTDPYTTLANWNTQLQLALNSSLTGPSTTLAANNAAYDVGHMFGASGGGGNAGCIGCVCVNGVASGTGSTKGRGITSPADGIPVGDNFDIDYVAHELGHQFGGNHTFSHSTEGTGVNVEPGSGSTIMGYAGITSQDVQPHSDDYFVYATIKQVQDNMVSKTCPTRTTLTHGVPVVNAGSDFTIPKSTPFILTGSATDSNNDILSYCWEQNDSATTQTGANSAAIISKTAGPNWRSYNPVAVPYRYFPRIQSIIANSVTTAGTDINVEALSSVARTLNFVLTARDSNPGQGLTGSDAMVVTVNATAGPFVVNSPNTAVTWNVGTNQTVTWSVAGTTANGINCNYVDVYLSTDGGNSYPILLASNVPNDGSEVITVPNNTGTTNRIMVKGHNHVFFDISNVNFTIAIPTASFALAFDGTVDGQNKNDCQGNNIIYNLNYSTIVGYSLPTTFTVSGNPAGTTAVFSPASISADGTVSLTIGNTTSTTPGFYSLVVTGTSGALTRTVNLYLEVLNASFTTLSLTSPSNLAEIASTSVTLNWSNDPAATLYSLQVATDSDFTNLFASTDVATNSYTVTGLTQLTNYYWRVLPKNAGCNGVYSTSRRFTTITNPCSTFTAIDTPITISASGTPTVTSTLTIPTANNVTITDVNVTVNISHTYASDLTVSLISPSPNNTIINLIVNQCTSNDNIIATFDDAGTTLVCGTNPAISGTITPTQLLSVLNGSDSQGLWTLQIADNANQDGGAINSWSLNICSTPIPLTCGQITTTWNGTLWSNGKPVDNMAATINGDLTINTELKACSLDIIGTSQVVLESDTNMIIDGIVDIASTASLTIENNANLIQNQNVTNVANAIVKRNTSPLMRLDYSIWSSPVTGTLTLKDFSPNTLTNRFYNYNTTTNFYQLVANPLTQTFGLGNGYLIRMPDNHPTTPTVWNGEFNGNINNGDIDVSLDYVSATQSFNMIGNPYPSTISAQSLLNANAASIFGTLYFWRKINNAAGTAYASYTLGGSTTTSPTSPTPNGTIQVGQGFFVRAKNIVNPTVAFTNSLRVGNNSDQFFRTSSPIENHRIWLNLTNNSGLFVQLLAGYMEGATNSYDDLFDAKAINDSSIGFSSFLDNEEYSIQLKSVPFNENDVIPLSFRTNEIGDYTISIDHVDGLFENNNQEIYLKDNQLQTIHSLSNEPYPFSSEAGDFANRFEIVYQSNLANTTFESSNSVAVMTSTNEIIINSSKENLNKITIYDLLGRTLYVSKTLNQTNKRISNLNARNQALILKIELQNGQTVVKKIVF